MAYQATGTPVTAAERELLDVLQEECAEVVGAISKILRFGKNDVNPKTRVDNLVELSREVGDLNYMLKLAYDNGLLIPSEVIDGFDAKESKLLHFLRHPEIIKERMVR